MPSRHVTWLLAGVMTVQSVLGLVFADGYRDPDWVRATWWGNDWVTLVVAVPLLLGSGTRARRSTRALLLWLGAIAYCVYNYAYYLFGAALNALFPLYLSAVLLAAFALATSLTHIDAARVASRFTPTTAVRAVGGYFASVGFSLAIVWLAMWAAYVLTGHSTPIAPEAFKLIAALDILLMAPALIIGGTWLWRRNPKGYVVASFAGVQASLYLLVLAVNAVVFVSRDLAEPPGEIPIWGTLAALTGAATLALLSHADRVEMGERAGAMLYLHTYGQNDTVQDNSLPRRFLRALAASPGVRIGTHPSRPGTPGCRVRGRSAARRCGRSQLRRRPVD